MNVPFLEGQPGWVVIVVVALLVISAITLGWFKRPGKRNSDSNPAGADTVIRDNATTVALAAMEQLGETVRREAEQSERAEREVRKLSKSNRELRDRLADCERERDGLRQRT